ncbi:MAG: iron ABC transporter permease [Coriobacteriales bacterium]|jgi:iron complex transport system permease protein|nr:iron ABC transporter permease [Coriobacteriales bacterium]
MSVDARHRSRVALLAALVGLAVLVCLFALGMGRFSIPVDKVFFILLDAATPLDLAQSWSDQMANVVLNVRLPRTLAALLVGSALSLSGAVYQGVFRNPLVSPDLLGVTSGACVGASLAILAHLGGLGVQLCALASGGLAVCCSIGISRLFRQSSNITLVLSGIVVAALFNSVLSLCQYVANVYDELPAIIFWTLGSMANMELVDVGSVAPVVLVVTVLLLVERWRINLLSLEEGEAQTLGVNVRRLRALTIVCATVLTASAVSICGSIGWVGLIIPHLGRLLTGSDNRWLMPVSCLLGGIFLVLVDTLARNLTASEIPLSIITGIVGAGLFVLIVVKRRMQL